MIRKKFELIKKYNKDLSSIFIRNLFRRHPDLFLRSLGSMQAKITYLTRTLNRQLQKEKAFPLLLHYDHTTHIWPRCESLRAMGIKEYDLVEAMTTSENEFCEKFEVSMELLAEKKAKKKYIEEKD